MQLTCPKCRHQWNDAPTPGSTTLLCPRCFSTGPADTFRQPPPPEPTVHGSPTLVVGQPGGSSPGAAPGIPPPSPPGDVGEPAVRNQEGDEGFLHFLNALDSSPDVTTPLHPGATPASARPTSSRSAPPRSTPQSGSRAAPQPSPSPSQSSQPQPSRSSAAAAPPSGPGTERTVSLGRAAPSGRPAEAAPPSAQPPSARSPQSAGSKPGAKFPELDGLIGQTIGGLRIEKRIGAGGMGAVFLARQLSLDRNVALKVLPSSLSANPELLARFTREALSAAQLSHHNIVHVYDVGNHGDTYFISMEFVKGDNLGDMVRRDGRLRVDDAAGYVLQAARGLNHAHKRGIIHRDIKPDNLIVNEHGIVKVADLGLAKMRGSADMTHGVASGDQALALANASPDLTQAHAAMGTPAYMAPEQARDAAGVDPRADQYSLGCTLYYLCAGRAPYSGTTVFELISKHLREPLTPLDVHVHSVPPAFSRIVQHMLEKDPAQRYPDLAAVIADLEDYLGIGAEAGPYRPRESHLAMLEGQIKSFYTAPALKLRRFVLTAFFFLLPVVLLASVSLRSFALAGAALGFWTLSILAHFLYDGIRNKTYLFRRVRSAVLGMPWRNWIATVVGAAASIGILYLLGWLPYWVGCGVAAFAVAAGYQALVCRPLRKQRSDQVWKMQQMLRELRIRGVSEDALQDFVARFSSDQWEEFFETLFGYEDMVVARASVAAMEKVKRRKSFARWRDPIFRFLDSVEEARRQEREQRQLARVEAKRLKAQGLSDSQANLKAEEEAFRILKEVRVVPVAESAARKAKARLTLRFHAATVRRIYAIARAVAGLAIIAAAAAVYAPQINVTIPPMISGLLNNYWSWGHGGNYFGLAAGVALFLSAFSKRVFWPGLIAVGAALMVFVYPIVSVVGQPQFSNRTAFLASLALVGAGFGFCLLKRLSGGRF